jgi:hypothetical protein
MPAVGRRAAGAGRKTMNLGFETIGNATLIGYDRRPVLVTDPWLTGNPYFGSWGLSHQIPQPQMHAIAQCEFVWISHGHPDHLSPASLESLRQQKILLPDHVGGLIYSGLKERGFDVHVLKDNVWTTLSDRIHVLCLCNENQDATLLVDINGRLIMNLNDSSAKGWRALIRKIAKTYRTSFLLKLKGKYGDADMLNFFNEDGTRILPDPPHRMPPLGPSVARTTEYFGAKYFIPFSSMHKYQRQDSIWIQPYATSLKDFTDGFQSRSSRLLPAFIRYDCGNDTWEEINPPETPSVIHDPKEFGDDWGELLDRSDILAATQYFRTIYHLTTTLDFINLRVGGKDHFIELSKRHFGKGITFEAPRHSLMLAIRHEIFDDMLIGNFMKTTLHGKLKRGKPTLYPDFAPYATKYADNGRAKSKEELASYFKEYRKRTGQSVLSPAFLLQELEQRSKNVVRSFIPQNSWLYQPARRAYYALRRGP